MPTAVQFGAGNIGRGFIAQLFHESGFEVVFVDVQPDLLQKLNRDRAYTIHIVGDKPEDVCIDDVRAVDGRDTDRVVSELADCDVACTAVGAGALAHIAAPLANGLSLRHRAGRSPLNILICENLHDAGDRLRRLVVDHLTPADRDLVLAETGFVQAVVSRMVPIQNPDESPDIRVEAYRRLPIDRRAIVGQMPDLVGIEPVDNFEAHVERKLYLHNCGHAVLGYLGYERGIEFAWQALEDATVRLTCKFVMLATGLSLLRKHGFDEAEFDIYFDDLLERFKNRSLGDTCFRLARDPIRKLAPNDRLVGAARLCESQDIVPNQLPIVIASALRFDSPDDPSAMELQDRIKGKGIQSVLSDVCRIDADEPLGQAVLTEYGR